MRLSPRPGVDRDATEELLAGLGFRHPAPAYDVTLWMGSPFPSTLVAPEVAVRIGGGAPSRLTLDQEIKPYRLRAVIPAGQPLVVRLDSPTWSRTGEPADQGVRVDRMTVSPALSGP